MKLNCSNRIFPKNNMWKVALVSQNVQNLKQIYWSKHEKIPMISCECADYYSSHHQRARGHKTTGSHLTFGLTDLRKFALKAWTHGATLRAALRATWKLHHVFTLEIVARNCWFCNITRNCFTMCPSCATLHATMLCAMMHRVSAPLLFVCILTAHVIHRLRNVTPRHASSTQYRKIQWWWVFLYL